MKKILYYHKSKNIFWFRIFNYGLCFNTTMRFSQRYGYTKYIKRGKWIITILKPKEDE